MHILLPIISCKWRHNINIQFQYQWLIFSYVRKFVIWIHSIRKKGRTIDFENNNFFPSDFKKKLNDLSWF